MRRFALSLLLLLVLSACTTKSSIATSTPLPQVEDQQANTPTNFPSLDPMDIPQPENINSEEEPIPTVTPSPRCSIEADDYTQSVSTRKISNNTAFDGDPQVNGDYVVWHGNLDGDFEIYLYQIRSDTTTQVSINMADDLYPQVYGDYIVWLGDEDGDNDIYLYQISNGMTAQVSNNTAKDYNPQIYGDYVVWVGEVDGDEEVYLYQISSGTTMQVSNNTAYDSSPKSTGTTWCGMHGQMATGRFIYTE